MYKERGRDNPIIIKEENDMKIVSLTTKGETEESGVPNTDFSEIIVDANTTNNYFDSLPEPLKIEIINFCIEINSITLFSDMARLALVSKKFNEKVNDFLNNHT